MKRGNIAMDVVKIAFHPAIQCFSDVFNTVLVLSIPYFFLPPRLYFQLKVSPQ